MNDAATGARLSRTVLSELRHAGKPDLASCDALAAQCFDALPNPIKIMNAAEHIVFYNRAAFQYFGPRVAWARSPGECDQLFHHEDHIARRQAREKVLKHGVPLRIDLRAIRFDYVPIWHEFDLTPLFDASQKVTGVLVRMTNIEEPRRIGQTEPPGLRGQA